MKLYYSKDVLEPIIKGSKTWSEVCRKLCRCLGGTTVNALKANAVEHNLSYAHFVGRRAASLYRVSPEHVLQLNSNYSRSKVKSALLELDVYPYICRNCKLGPEWMGQPLTLILDHINGDGEDHRVENLRFLCPNCNEQLPTNKGKKHLGKSMAFHHNRRIKDQHVSRVTPPGTYVKP